MMKSCSTTKAVFLECMMKRLMTWGGWMGVVFGVSVWLIRYMIKNLREE